MRGRKGREGRRSEGVYEACPGEAVTSGEDKGSEGTRGRRN